MPVYDEPEFIVHNIWRLYGGWWDLNPANLKPAPEVAIAAEIVLLCGGVNALVDRAQHHAADGELRLACALIEFATSAEPQSLRAHGARAEIYQERRDRELSLMAKGVFASAANESRSVVDNAHPTP